MKAGTKFNLIYKISREGLMVRIMLKQLEFKSMLIVVLEEYISQIDNILKKKWE